MGRTEVTAQGDLQILVHDVTAGLQTGEQSTTTHNTVQILRLDIVASQEVLDKGHAHRHLVDDVLILCQFGRIVGHVLLDEFFFIPVEGQFGAGGAGIDNQL